MTEINLLPPELQPPPIVRWKFVAAIVAIVVVISGAVVSGYTMSLEIAGIQRQVSIVQSQVNSLLYLEDKQSSLSELKQQAETAFTQYKDGRPLESYLLGIVAEALPTPVSLDYINISGEGNIAMGGSAPTYEAVSLLAMSLELYEDISSVQLGGITKADAGLIRFQLSCQISWFAEKEGQEDATN